MFEKILIANRGEVALRIIRTCRRMGIKTVAVFSEADFRSPYVREADEAVFLGGPRALDSYLKGPEIVAAAQDKGCQAVHPGYGFLSENAGFARMVASAGLIFIGPPAEAIALLGDKTASKELAVRAGVPVVPGHHQPLGGPAEAEAVALKVGFPLLLKPAAGGGGRGMRLVRRREELGPALTACREETSKGFADDRIFIERYIEKPRHIEVQIMADRYGAIIHLGERECSIQRRYQKIIEEAPSPAVDPDLRAELGRLACGLAREAGYVNAGTVEFIFGADRSFYFLEMNTRLQVEHPVTELVTGLDLVEWQIRIADGQPLPRNQEEIKVQGWAIEARVCAEDPARSFLPTTGMITRYAVPRGQNIRVDAGIEAGSLITIYYDSLLSKVAAFGQTREEARQTLIRALNGYHIEGLTTNVDFVNAVANHPAFARADLSTDFIEENFQDGVSKLPPDREHLNCMVMAALLVFHTRQYLVRESLNPMIPLVGRTPDQKIIHHYVARADQDIFQVQLEGNRHTQHWAILVDNQPYQVITPKFEYFRRRLVLKINGRSHMFRMQYDSNHIKTNFCGLIRTIEIYNPAEWELAGFMLRGRKEVRDNVLRCPLPGLVVALNVQEGDYVRRGQELLRIESMKMESGIVSPRDAVVEKISVQPGQTVDTDQILLTFRPE
ncbi:MAG: biotin carboxylase N-terminal domain-containing protein [Pseudomonadota bacterium]